jgi:hypothetical protein
MATAEQLKKRLKEIKPKTKNDFIRKDKELIGYFDELNNLITRYCEKVYDFNPDTKLSIYDTNIENNEELRWCKIGLILTQKQEFIARIEINHFNSEEDYDVSDGLPFDIDWKIYDTTLDNASNDEDYLKKKLIRLRIYDALCSVFVSYDEKNTFSTLTHRINERVVEYSDMSRQVFEITDVLDYGEVEDYELD